MEKERGEEKERRWNLILQRGQEDTWSQFHEETPWKDQLVQDKKASKERGKNKKGWEVSNSSKIQVRETENLSSNQARRKDKENMLL